MDNRGRGSRGGSGGGRGGRGGHDGGGGRGDRGGRGGGYGGGDRGGRGGGYGGGDGGGRGGGYGGGGGRGGGGFQRGAPPTYMDPNRCPDPYNVQYTLAQKQLQQQGWQPFPEKQADVVLQKYNDKGKPAPWDLKTITVSVNHFKVEPAKNPKSFPFPPLYHYDISYEIIRNKKGQEEAKPGPSKRGKKKGGGGTDEPGSTTLVDVQSVTIKLEQSGLSPKKAKGEKPPNKKLPKHLTNIILNYLIPKLRQQYRLHGIATDGSFNLYSTRKFHEAGSGATIPLQHEVTFAELREAKLMEEEEHGTIRVMFEPTIDKRTGVIHTIDTSEIAKYYQSNGGSLRGYTLPAELRGTLEAACNAFVKSCPNFQYFSVGRSTMVPCEQKNTAPLGGGLVPWRGISANISMGWKPYLNVDIANCAFMLDKSVLEVLSEVLPRSDVTDVQRWSYRERDEAKSFLKTCKVFYKVDGHKFGGPVRDVDAKGAKNCKFRWEEKNKDISVFDYYKERYGESLKYPNGPILVIRKSAKVPAELCTIKKGQSYNRKLDGNQTSEMLKFAKRNPDELERDILNKVQEMNLKQNEVLNALGIQIPEKMLSTNARVLVPPTLRYGNNKVGQVAHVNPEGGTWEIWSHDYSFFRTVKVEKWGLLVVGCPRIRGSNDDRLRAFIDSLKQNGKLKGVELTTTDPHVAVDSQCRPDNPQQNKKILNDIFRSQFSGCKLVVVVFPQKGSPLYGHVKHAAEVDVGILTQCVAEKNVSFLKDATVQNILLKINSKLGGINHVTVAPFDREKASKFSTLIMDCPLLVLGADVTHAPPGSKKVVTGIEFTMPSYAAVTGSLDKTCMPFMTEVRAQRKADAGAAEVIQDLDNIVTNMLTAFREKSRVIPQKIIYFRDGVGEGQFPEVLHVEMSAIRRACSKLSPKYQPKITFITVQKRHKTGILYNNNGRTENAPAGTVIDKEIVHPSETDFYLLSHRGMLGTSRPSRYHVLWDDSDFSQDVLQSLAYTLCYMYVRCTKSVKMPAPNILRPSCCGSCQEIV